MMGPLLDVLKGLWCGLFRRSDIPTGDPGVMPPYPSTEQEWLRERVRELEKRVSAMEQRYREMRQIWRDGG